MGARVLRVSPQSTGTQAAIAALDATRHGAPAAEVAPPAGMERCNGYYYGHAASTCCGSRHEPEPARAAALLARLGRKLPAPLVSLHFTAGLELARRFKWLAPPAGWMAGASPSPSRTWACAAASPCAAARSARVGRRAGRA